MDATDISPHAAAQPAYRRVASACVAAMVCAVLLILLAGYFAIYAALDGSPLSLEMLLYRTPRLICVMARLCSA